MAIPTDGLVFYAPLAEDKATAETGQTLETFNSILFPASLVQCSAEEKKFQSIILTTSRGISVSAAGSALPHRWRKE